MAEYKHTRGPWRAESGRVHTEPTIIYGDGIEVARVTPAVVLEELGMVEANGDLIADAPDLLVERDNLREAVKGLLLAPSLNLDELEDADLEAIQTGQKALWPNKATGEAVPS